MQQGLLDGTAMRMFEDRLRYKLHLARRRLYRRRVEKFELQLEVNRLRHYSLFSQWPSMALMDVCKAMVLEAYRKGEVLAYCNEPRGISSLFWIVSGGIKEFRPRPRVAHACRLSLSVASEGSNSAFKETSLDQGNDSSHTKPLYSSSGKLVPVDSLLLGHNYQRTVQCESDVVLFRVPFDTVMHIGKIRGAPLGNVILTAKENLQQQMLVDGEKPTMESVLNANSLLRGIDNATLGVIWMALSPLVVCDRELVCSDVLTSENIFFLQSGCIRVGHDGCASVSYVNTHGKALGLHRFMPTELVLSSEEQRPAVATKISLLWRIPLKVLMHVVSLGEWRACAQAACKLIRITVKPVMLKKIAVLSSFTSEMLGELAKLMQLRVVRSGECLLEKGEIPQQAMIVVAGACHLVGGASDDWTSTTAKTAKPLTRGHSVGFEECISGKSMGHRVISCDNSVLLVLERNVILHALQNGGFLTACAPPKSTKHILTSPRAHSQLKVSGDPTPRAPPGVCGEDVGDMKIASEADIDRTTQNNKVLSTLLMQLNDLCPGSGTHIMDQSDYDLASHSVTRNLERNERMGSYRAKSCFTIDGDGRVKFSSNGATLERVQVSFKKKPELQRETAPQCVQAEVPLTVFEAIKNGLPKDNKGEPLARELRCAPLSGFTSVIGQCPASHRVRALRREVKSLGEEVERTSILPIRGFIPTSTARFVVHGM